MLSYLCYCVISKFQNHITFVYFVCFAKNSCEVGCSNVERKLRQLLDIGCSITEDEAYFHTGQSAFLYYLRVQTMPKIHHWLNMRLTLEFFKSTTIHEDQLNKQILEDPAFHHYVMFTRNVLAALTTINSTAMNSKDSGNIVFRLFTDVQNFYVMKHWFDRTSYLEAIVYVTNIEDHQKLSKGVQSVEMQQLWPTEELCATFRNHSQPFQRQMKTEYISVFGHSHFLPALSSSLLEYNPCYRWWFGFPERLVISVEAQHGR